MPSGRTADPHGPASPRHTRLAEALRTLQSLQRSGRGVFPSADFDSAERRALVDSGFLQPIIRGWYMATRPDEKPGDTTPWYASMRQFIAAYSNKRFRKRWHVSPAWSVQLHAATTVIPRQVIVHAPKATNNVLELPGGCSLLEYAAPDFEPDEVEQLDELRVLRLAAGLVRVPESFFRAEPTDARIALGRVTDASDLNRLLLTGGNRVKAGALAGAFRSIGRDDIAADILGAMRSAGYVVIESNPFDGDVAVVARSRAVSPYVVRMQMMWQAMRAAVIELLPTPPGLPADREAFLQAIEDIYRTDAYHSLSIEGYRVSDDLVARVASGNWDPGAHAADANARDALAAHGYWRAFEAVKSSAAEILDGANAGTVAAREHGAWYRELFGPAVGAGILGAADLAGYRNGPVYIRNARHVPPSRDAVRDMMPALFDLLESEPEPQVRAVLGHFIFVYIHPYADGNGRLGRFLMNAMLASGGYAWTVIRLERRDEYMAALNAASSDGDIRPFASFIASSMPASSW
jgi:hypothetical protein